MKKLLVASVTVAALVTTAWCQSAVGQAGTLAGIDRISGDTAWQDLNDLLPGKDRGSPQAPRSYDWSSIADQAKSFRERFPNHPQARAAAKIALIASVHIDDGRAEIATATVTAAEAFVGDPRNPVRDRLEVKITLEQAKLQRRTFTSRADRLQKHAEHARSLIRDFPAEPEGYGYLLAQAKAQSTENVHDLADELLQTVGTPEAFKEGARRVVARLRLVGRPLLLNGAESALAEAKDRPVVVYSWTVADQGFLEVVRWLADSGGAFFIGVNLDQDRASAKALATKLKLPGVQIYDGDGLNGPAARQLQLIMSASLYYVDGQRVMRDVNAHLEAHRKLAELVRGTEVRS